MGVLSVLFMGTMRLWEVGEVEKEEGGASMREALGRGIVWMQVGLFFIYAGVEASAGQWLFTLMTEGRGVEVAVAGVMVGTYWAALTVGRIVFGQVAAVMSAEAVLRWVTFLGVVVLGFGLAPVFPTLVSVTPGRVGRRFAAQAIGFQMAAATLGIAMWPGVVGVMARGWGLEVVGVYLVAGAVAAVVWHEATMRVARAGASAGD
jgi:fucose permease